MAIKSEEKNERAIVSKRLPSFAISRKHKTSTVDTSVSNVSSKKSKRTVVRKNKKKLNNINLEASEIKEVQEVQKVVSEIPEEISNTNDINDKKQETAEVTISLETVTKKSNENINSNSSSDEMVNEKEIINKTILDEDVNIDKLEEYEINSAKNIIIKKSNGMEEQDIIQYLLKKGYKIDLIKMAIQEIGE